MRYPLIVLAALLGLTTSASAQDTFTPAVTFPAGQAAIDSRAIDVLSLLPGMKVQEAKTALAAHYSSETIVEHPTSFQVASRGVTIKTTEFVGSVNAGNADDTIELTFTGQASDNQLFAVERKLVHPDVLSAPTVDSILEALLAKYGAPSMNSLDSYKPSPNNPAVVFWSYSRGQQVPCSYLIVGNGPGCTLLSLGYDPGMLQQIASDAPDFDYSIRATIWPNDDDISKARSFIVEVTDFSRRQKAAQADTQALLSELDRVHAQASQPAAAPAL